MLSDKFKWYKLKLNIGILNTDSRLNMKCMKLNNLGWHLHVIVNVSNVYVKLIKLTYFYVFIFVLFCS